MCDIDEFKYRIKKSMLFCREFNFETVKESWRLGDRENVLFVLFQDVHNSIDFETDYNK